MRYTHIKGHGSCYIGQLVKSEKLIANIKFVKECFHDSGFLRQLDINYAAPHSDRIYMEGYLLDTLIHITKGELQMHSKNQKARANKPIHNIDAYNFLFQ